jgi:peroxiredoxin
MNAREFHQMNESSSKRGLSYAVGFALVIVYTQFASGVQDGEPLGGRLASAEFRWRGGDTLAGELVSMTDRTVRIQSRFFEEPIELDRSVLESVRFVWPAQEMVRANADYELVLKDGSTLHTDIERIREGAVWINDSRFGRVRIPIQQCALVRAMGTVQYEWAGDLADWKHLEAEGTLVGPRWFVDANGALATTSENAKLWLPLQLKESFVLSIRFADKNKADFVISTGRDADSSLRVGTIGENIVIGTADDFEIAGEVQEGPFSVQLVWNAGTKELSMRSPEGKILAITHEKGVCDKSGILIHNQGSQLTIDALRVSRGLASTVSENVSNPSFPFATFASGEKVEMRSAQLENGEWSFESLDGKIVHPKAEFSVLQFGPIQKAEPNTVVPGTTKVRWRDGSWLQFETLSIGDGALHVRLNVSMPMLDCSLSAIDRILIAGTEVRGASLDKLVVGSNRMTGQLQFGDAKSPLRWQCNGQRQPTAIASEIPLEVTFERRGNAKDTATGFRDILYFVNGDVVPCLLSTMNATSTTVSTPLGGIERVPNAVLSSIELNADGTKLRHSFTKESREMMLTIPRTGEASLTTHVLLGSNGDLLRGSVIALSDETVELDSKQEPMLVDRDRVLAIAYLAQPKGKMEQSKDEPPKDADPIVQLGQFPELAMKLRGGYRLTARFVSVADQQIHCESQWIGNCKIPFEQIEAIATLKPNFGSDLSPYSAWATQFATAPRWSSNQPSEAAPGSMLGKKVPEFQLSALDGSTFKLSEYNGRVVVLDFWATWCGPCVASLPEYLEAMREFAATDAVFLGVNSSETPEVVRSFVESKKLEGFNSLFDFDQSLLNTMGVGGIPHTVVIGPSGEVAHVHVGYTVGAAKEVAQVIRQLLQK